MSPLVDLLLAWGGSLGGLVLLTTYIMDNRWWSSLPGRALVGLALGITLLLGGGTIRRLLGGGEHDVYATVALICVDSIIGGLDYAFIRYRQSIREQSQRHTDADQEYKDEL